MSTLTGLALGLAIVVTGSIALALFALYLLAHD